MYGAEERIGNGASLLSDGVEILNQTAFWTGAMWTPGAGHNRTRQRGEDRVQRGAGAGAGAGAGGGNLI